MKQDKKQDKKQDIKQDKLQKNGKEKRWLRLLAVLLWMGIIFWFSSRTGEESAAESMPIAALLGIPDFVVRKGAHMTEYGILAVLFFRFLETFEWKRRSHFAGAVLGSVCYAATDEIHQLFSAGRSGQLRDVCIDALGAFLGVLIFVTAVCIIQKQSQKRRVL